MTDVIEMLEHDHREVEEMFVDYERATGTEERETLRDRIIIELVRHSEAEEQAVYPLVRRVIDNGDKIIEHEIDEHSKAERIMKELDTMSADDPQFGVLMQQLMASIKEHVQEEENDVFPQFRSKVKPEELQKLGKTVEALKKIVPTHPHPMAPDHPPVQRAAWPRRRTRRPDERQADRSHRPINRGFYGGGIEASWPSTTLRSSASSTRVSSSRQRAAWRS